MVFRFYAQDKGPQYTLETTSSERVKHLLDYYGMKKWGFTIYRCTYGDDQAWERFMKHLSMRTNEYLQYDAYHGDEHAQCLMQDLAQRLDWNVQADPTLEGATKDEVRRRFRRWVASDARTEFPADVAHHKIQELLMENPRYNYCIHVDADALDSVINRGPPPTQADPYGVSYVNLVRADEDWKAPDFDKFDWATRKLGPDEEEDLLDDGEPEIEGSRLHDVGWMKASLEGLVPGVYDLLVQNMMWDNFYLRPPGNVWRY